MRGRFLTTMLFVFSLASPAFGVITGGKDEPMKVLGCPRGSLELANLPTRIAWWEGPPFGGGQYHFEYSGRTADLQKAIDLFAKVESQRSQVVIRAGVHTSFWLGIQDQGKKHPIDWEFVAWVPKNWQHLRDARAGLLPPGEEGEAPLTVLNIFVTERIDWKALNFPPGLAIADERLEAHGIAAEQGAAIQGQVLDSAGNPIADAVVTVGKDTNERKGSSDSKGQFLITKISEGNHQIIVAANGFASKDLYYHAFNASTYRSFEIALAKAANITVRVVDQQDKPLSGIDIRITHCRDQQGNYYRFAGPQQYRSDSNGECVVRDVPEGSIKFMSRTRGYYYNSVLNEHNTGESPITLKLLPTGSVRVSVFTTSGVPVTSEYMVEIAERASILHKGAASAVGVGRRTSVRTARSRLRMFRLVHT